jgi:hypothetical protein
MSEESNSDTSSELASLGAMLFVLMLIPVWLFGSSIVDDRNQERLVAAHEQDQRERKAEKRSQAKNYAMQVEQGYQGRHDFLEKILSSSDDVAKVTVQDVNGDHCSRRTWAVPVKVVYEVETRQEAIDTLYPSVSGLDQGDLPYVPIPDLAIRDFEDIQTAISGYLAAHPELKPERDEPCLISVSSEDEGLTPLLVIKKPEGGLLFAILPNP